MSTVGQAVGGIVGGVIGWFVGGPSGAVYGAQIGMMVGGALDPPKGPNINGPRLTDLTAQTSTYGTFIPRVYGTTALYGNVIWLQGNKLTEVVTKKKSGGKGGPTSTTTTYSYNATFAVGLCEGPIIGVRRIWVGPKLIYDAGSADVATVVASNERASNFKIYLGSDTQLPDPRIQADRGVANTPAYRGLAYIVLYDYPLAAHSNSLMAAQVKVEVVTSGVLSYSLSMQSSITTGARPYGVAISGIYAYVINFNDANLQVFNIANPATPFLVSTVTGLTSAQFITVQGDYAYIIDYGDEYKIFDISNPSAPVLVNTVVVHAGSGNLPGMVVSGDYAYVINRSGSTLNIFSSKVALVSSLSIGGDPYAIAISGIHVYIANYLSATLQIFDVSNPGSPFLVGSIATGGGPVYVVTSGIYAYVANNSSSTIQVFDVSNAAAPSLVATIASGAGAPWVLSISGNYLCAVPKLATANLQVFNIANPAAIYSVGTIVTNGAAGFVAASGNYAYVTNSDTNTMQAFFFADGIIASNSVALSSIVQAECLKSNLLTAGDIDVTALTDTVRGYRVASLGAIRGAIEPLRGAWPFDVVQSGYKIKFKKRGSASVATIPWQQLDARAVGDAPGIRITDSREMDSILPYKVSIKHLDINREYDPGEQYAERLNTDSVNTQSLDLAIVFTSTEAAQKAEMLLYLYWLERYDLMFKLGPAYLNLEPGDVITVTGENATYNLRLTSANYLPDGRIECQSKYDSAALYVPAAVGADGQSTGVTLTLAGPSAYEMMDIPTLLDVFDTPGFPVAMTGYLSGWPGGSLFRSQDSGQTWDNLQGFVSPGAEMGYTTNSLAAHDGRMIDKAGSLNVKLYAGTLSSVTELQMLNGSNYFAYGIDSRWEIIAAQNCVLQGDGSYTITDLLRGRYGTEWATGLHIAGDHVVLLNTTDLAFISVNLNTIGLARTWRAITLGKTIDTDTNRTFAYTAVNLKCLSPIYLNGDRNPSTNGWSLNWIRRTRVGGAWRDLVDASLGEATESYSMDIYDGAAYTTVKRTIAVTTAAAAYTSAQQVTDFGANQTTLYVRLYQISANTGRGYPLITSITR